MDFSAFAQPKAGGGLPDFASFAQPREKVSAALPDFASKVPKTKAPPTGPTTAPQAQARGNVATFTATHKQWHGQVELFPDGTFTRVGKDGGTWKTVWDEQRDTDDGGQSGDLILTWEKWGDEKLRSSDGGHVFKHQEYTFELELMSAQVPMWITTEMDSPPSSPDDDPRAPTSRSDDPRAQSQATSRSGAGSGEWERGAAGGSDAQPRGGGGANSGGQWCVPFRPQPPSGGLIASHAPYRRHTMIKFRVICTAEARNARRERGAVVAEEGDEPGGGPTTRGEPGSPVAAEPAPGPPQRRAPSRLQVSCLSAGVTSRSAVSLAAGYTKSERLRLAVQDAVAGGARDGSHAEV
jgi:hypothetical protein